LRSAEFPELKRYETYIRRKLKRSVDEKEIIPYWTFFDEDHRISWGEIMGDYGFFYNTLDKTFVFMPNGTCYSSSRVIRFIRGLKSGGFLNG
jgi:hypothetical protein